MSTLVECKGLSHSYGKKKALDDINLTIGSGRIVGLFGPNGSGKTTLIKRKIKSSGLLFSRPRRIQCRKQSKRSSRYV